MELNVLNLVLITQILFVHLQVDLIQKRSQWTVEVGRRSRDNRLTGSNLCVNREKQQVCYEMGLQKVQL